MDFLVLMRAIEPMTIPGPEVAARAIAQMELWDKLTAAGNVVYTAPYVGRKARVAVYRVESLEELLDFINQDPLFHYMQREVIPLADNAHLKRIYTSRTDDSNQE